jgi:hypothetical protein
MNVEIGTEAVQFPEKGYTNGFFLAVWPLVIPGCLFFLQQAKADVHTVVIVSCLGA